MNVYDPLALFKAHSILEERAERNASRGRFLVGGEILVRNSPREESIKHVWYLTIIPRARMGYWLKGYEGYTSILFYRQNISNMAGAFRY